MIGRDTVLYLAMCSSRQAPGVKRKIEGFIDGARSCGYDSKALIIEPGGMKKYLEFFTNLALAHEHYVVIRYINRIGLLIFLAGLVLGIRNRKLIIDVPTPMQNHFQEISQKNTKCVVDFLDMLLILLQGSLPFLPAHRILQYAEEGRWHSLGVKNKTVKIGNGVNVKLIPCRTTSPPWPAPNLILVAVGTVAFWHGWDRVIDAMSRLREDPEVTFRITFKIIGDGPAVDSLKKRAAELDMLDSVTFKGMLYGNELYAEYAEAHWGVGSLGWHRLGITEASPLKSREYLAAGLPFIYATDDPDFNEDSDVALKISTSESIDDLCEMLKGMTWRSFPLPSECRRFAESKLDFDHKVRVVLPTVH